MERAEPPAQETELNSVQSKLAPSAQRPHPQVAELQDDWRTYSELTNVIQCRVDGPHDAIHWLPYHAHVLNVQLHRRLHIYSVK